MKNKSTSFKHTVCVCVFDAGEKQSCVHHQMTSNGHQSQFRLVNDLKFRRLRSFLPLATVAMFSIRYFQTHHVAWWPPNNITNNIDSHMFRPDLIPLQLSLSLSLAIYYAIKLVEKSVKNQQRKGVGRFWNVEHCHRTEPLFWYSFYHIHLVIKWTHVHTGSMVRLKFMSYRERCRESLKLAW